MPIRSGGLQSKMCRTVDIACRFRRSTVGRPTGRSRSKLAMDEMGPPWSGLPGICESIDGLDWRPGPEKHCCRSHEKEIIVSRANLWLGLLTAGLCLAFLCPGLTSSAQPVWEQAEERSGVLNKKASPPAGRIVSPATSPTLSRWRGPRISRAVVRNSAGRSAPGGARTSLVSLTSTSSVLDTCGGDPDIEPMVISVTPAGINGPNYQHAQP